MRIDVKKLHEGCIDIKDYTIRKLIQNNESAEVYYGGEKMTIPASELKTRAMAKSKPMKSKFGSPDYHLIAFQWIPDQIEL